MFLVSGFHGFLSGQNPKQGAACIHVAHGVKRAAPCALPIEIEGEKREPGETHTKRLSCTEHVCGGRFGGSVQPL